MKYEEQDAEGRGNDLEDPLLSLGAIEYEEYLDRQKKAKIRQRLENHPKYLVTPEAPKTPTPIGPKDIQSLVSMTGQYLMNVGSIMRRAPNTLIDNDELVNVAHALQVVIGHMTTVRERLVALSLVMAMGSEDPEDPEGSEDPTVLEAPVDSEGPKEPEVPEGPEVPKDTIGESKGGMEGGPGPGSKSPVLGAEIAQSHGDCGLPAHEDEARISGCMFVLSLTREEAIEHLKREVSDGP